MYASLTGRSFKCTRPVNYAREINQEGAQPQKLQAPNRRTTYRSEPVAKHSGAPASRPRLPRTKQSDALQNGERVTKMRITHTHRDKRRRPQGAYQGRGDSCALMAVTKPDGAPHNADTPRHATTTATATTGAGEERKRERGAAPHPTITVRMAPPRNHGSLGAHSAE